MAINFKTDQNGLYADPLNGAIIKGDRNNTNLTFQYINDDTFVGDPYGNIYSIPGGSTDINIPGQTVFETPANKNKKMNTLQTGGAASNQQQQIVQQVAQMLQQGANPQDVMKQLVKAGIPAKDAEKLLTSIIQQMQAGQQQMASEDTGAQEPQSMMARYGGDQDIDFYYRKAQEGGEGNPQQQIMQLMQQIAQALQQGADPQEIMQQLVEMGVPEQQAQQMIQGVMQQLQQQGGGDQQQAPSPEEQEAMMGQQDQEGMMEQEQEMQGQGMMAEGGEPCFDCFDHYNPSPQAQNLNWFYKEQGGQAYDEAFPQAQTYLPYMRKGETRPNFMFEMGGQSDIDKAYQIMKKGGFDMNPKKKKGGKFNHLDEFKKFLEQGGGLNTYAPGGDTYNDPNNTYKDPSGQNREIKFDPNTNDWYYMENGEMMDVSYEDQQKLDQQYGSNPGTIASNKTPGTPGTTNTNNQIANDQYQQQIDQYNQLRGSYAAGQNLTQLLGPKGGAAATLLSGLTGLGAMGMGMGLGMGPGKSKFKAKVMPGEKRGLFNRWDIKPKGQAAIDTVPEYFGYMKGLYANQGAAGAGTTPGGTPATTPGGAPGAGGTDPNATTTNQDTTNAANASTSNPLQDRMNAMMSDLNFNPDAYNNQKRALRHYERGINDKNYRGKGWDYDQNINNPEYTNMLNDDTFDSTRYNNLERAQRQYTRGINSDPGANQLEGINNLKGKGWEGTRNQMTQNLTLQMANDPAFNASLYRNDEKALRDWMRGSDANNSDMSGKGYDDYNYRHRFDDPKFTKIRDWNRLKEDAEPSFNYDMYDNPDRALRHFIRGRGKGWTPKNLGYGTGYEYGGMTEYAPGGTSWGAGPDWKFVTHTPTNVNGAYAFQRGALNQMDESNKYNAQLKNLQSKTTLNLQPFAQTAGKSENYLGTLNARANNPDRTNQPGNFSVDAFMPRLLNNVTAKTKTGGSILDYYEDGAEVDLDDMTPQERAQFIRAVYEAGGSVEYI